MITDIKIQDKNYTLDWEAKLSGLSKINIFENDCVLLEKFNILRKSIITNNIPEMTEDADICQKCLYLDFCGNKRIKKELRKKKTNEIIYSNKHQPTKLRNTFML